MKKQYFIFLAITCMSVMFSVNAQNTPIDDFLKTYPSRDGVTHVSMSQQMLQSIYTSPGHTVRVIGTSAIASTPVISSTFRLYVEERDSLSNITWRMVPRDSLSNNTFRWFPRDYSPSTGDITIPDAYSSVSVSKKDIPENLYTDFKKTLLSTKYEMFMEKNSENNNILGYYLKKANENTNEIVVINQQKDQFSAIYIKGEIDINNVNRHLNMIRNALNQLGSNQDDVMIQSFVNQFAFAMPGMEDFKINLPDLSELKNQFDNEDFKEKVEELIKNLKNSIDDDLQGKIRDAKENALKQLLED